MKRLGQFLLSAILIFTVGCAPASTDAGVAPNNANGSTAPQGEPISTAYSLILQHSVVPVKPPALAAAGITGLRDALLVDGIMPPSVITPAFTDDPNLDLQLLAHSVTGTLGQYSPKLSEQAADNAVISQMAQSVGDCHTIYFTPSQFSDQVASIQGHTQFGGIGASLRKVKTNDPLVIWRVFAGTPAAKSGLREGDVITAVDGQSVTGETVQTVVNQVRGPIGQPVRLTILAPGQSAPHDIVVFRAEIQPPNVEYRMLANQVGYLQLYGFPEGVASQVQQALDALNRQGARSLIVDVRDNGGGALDSVEQVLSTFTPRNTLLFSLYDASGKKTDYHSTGPVQPQIPRSVVLMNDGTGSGAEIFAAVLQEQGLAQLVGTKTAGCVGTGQIFPLPGGAGLQITVAQLRTGKGKVLNGVGVSPDVTVPMSPQDLIAGQDPQLAQAIQLLQTGH